MQSLETYFDAIPQSLPRSSILNHGKNSCWTIHHEPPSSNRWNGPCQRRSLIRRWSPSWKGHVQKWTILAPSRNGLDDNNRTKWDSWIRSHHRRKKKNPIVNQMTKPHNPNPKEKSNRLTEVVTPPEKNWLNMVKESRKKDQEEPKTFWIHKLEVKKWKW